MASNKFPWNKEQQRAAHAELLKKVNKHPAKLTELSSIEYGDDGIARFTNSNNKSFEHSMVTPSKPVVDKPITPKAPAKKAAAKKAVKAK